jgi:hypothetical protein
MRISTLRRPRRIAFALGALWLAGCMADAIFSGAAPTPVCAIVAGGMLAFVMSWLARGLGG